MTINLLCQQNTFFQFSYQMKARVKTDGELIQLGHILCWEAKVQRAERWGCSVGDLKTGEGGKTESVWSSHTSSQIIPWSRRLGFRENSKEQDVNESVWSHELFSDESAMGVLAIPPQHLCSWPQRCALMLLPTGRHHAELELWNVNVSLTLLGVYPEVELLSHMVTNFLSNCQQFLTWF